MVGENELEKITGIMMYYYCICPRKLLYFSHEIQMEQEDENVAVGKVLDETSYSREEKHININNVINIDFLRSSGVLHEVKKSKKIEEASVMQVKYYLYYLKQKGVNITAKIDYPLLKSSIDVELNKEDEKIIEENIVKIKEIVNNDKPEALQKKKICGKCAYSDLCFI